MKMTVMGMGMFPNSHNGPPKWRFGATMSSVIVTWCMAGSLPTATGIPQNEIFKQGCMVMASQETVFGSPVLISHVPMSLAPTGVRLF